MTLGIGEIFSDLSRLQELSRFSKRASCLNAPSREPFFSEDMDVQARVTEQWCAECPVRMECLSYALIYNEEFGVWGGTTETERKVMRRKLYQKSLSGVRGPEAVSLLINHIMVNGSTHVDSRTIVWIRSESKPLEDNPNGIPKKRGRGTVVGTEWPF